MGDGPVSAHILRCRPALPPENRSAGSDPKNGEVMMSKLRILSARGDTVVEWDLSQAEAGRREARAAVEEAERIFEAARARGATAFKVAAGQPAERLDRFDPRADEVVIVPRVAGGAISPIDKTAMTAAG